MFRHQLWVFFLCSLRPWFMSLGGQQKQTSQADFSKEALPGVSFRETAKFIEAMGSIYIALNKQWRFWSEWDTLNNSVGRPD